jgi:hypothetical protein
LAKVPYVESPPNFDIKVWWKVPTWNLHQTSTSKFGERILCGNPRKFWH